MCYVSEEQSIRGVSSPFQLVLDGEGACSIAGSFGGASNDILTVIEQADGSILITSDLVTLHTNIKMVSLEPLSCNTILFSYCGILQFKEEFV